MFTVILAAALIGQQPRVGVAPPPRAEQSLGNPTLARRQAKRIKRSIRNAIEEEQAHAAQIEAAKQAERMLPYQLKMQQLALENQRQWLQRQSDYERNQALSSLAQSANWQAQALDLAARNAALARGR